MNTVEIIVISIVGIVAFYIACRLMFSAFFMSLEDYLQKRRKRNG